MSRTETTEEARRQTAILLDRHFNRPLEERIRERAYELYVQRGYKPGQADRDWFDAEEELLANR